MELTVLTGDLVDSSHMSRHDLDKIIEGIHALAVDMSDWPIRTAPPTPAGFARRGGDGWQIACDSTLNTLRATLCIQARVRATLPDASTRIAVATGAGEIAPNLNSAHGAAFTASGQLLDTLEDGRLMAHAQGGSVDAMFCLADHIAQDWTQAQARALALKLQPAPIANRVIAETLGVSRQAVDQALAAAGYGALKTALSILDEEGASP